MQNKSPENKQLLNTVFFTSTSSPTTVLKMDDVAPLHPRYKVYLFFVFFPLGGGNAPLSSSTRHETWRRRRTPLTPPPPQLLSSTPQTADVVLTSASTSANMFNFTSKLLLLFLLAFPCGLISVGKHLFMYLFHLKAGRYICSLAPLLVRSFSPNILTWHSHRAIRQLSPQLGQLLTWI